MGIDGVGDTVEQLGAIDGLGPWLRIDQEVGGIIGVVGSFSPRYCLTAASRARG